jgi:hypothetical protein
MKLQRDQRVIAFCAIVIALVIFLFPEWIATHATGDDLIMRLGYGWIFSNPPHPPAPFVEFQVERDWSSNIYLAFFVLIMGAGIVAFNPRKAKPE